MVSLGPFVLLWYMFVSPPVSMFKIFHNSLYQFIQFGKIVLVINLQLFSYTVFTVCTLLIFSTNVFCAINAERELKIFKSFIVETTLLGFVILSLNIIAKRALKCRNA